MKNLKENPITFVTHKKNCLDYTYISPFAERPVTIVISILVRN